MKPRIVVSAVNLVDMGPRTVMVQALEALAREHSRDYEIVALVHDRSLFGVPNIAYLEFPAPKRSWLKRLKFEYYDLRALSRELDADLWLSMHDITPNVTARRQAVYCHNPSPFYGFHARDLFWDWRFSLFTLLYRVLYGVRIRANDFVIVQQDWMRAEFRRMYGVANVIVAYPESPGRAPARGPAYRPGTRPCRFFYPCFPRVFKNVETLLEAARLAGRSRPGAFTLDLTFDGTENRYAANLVKRYGHVPEARFRGLLPHSEVLALYEETDCLVFASRLETWGLPITEFKDSGRPMLLADLPYARETAARGRAAFFDPGDPERLAALMEAAIDGRLDPAPVSAAQPPAPFCGSWSDLFRLLLPSPEAAL